MCHCLLVKKVVVMGIHLWITRCVEEFLKNRTFRMKLCSHLSSEGIVKSGVLQGSVLGPLLSLVFIIGLIDELTCNRLPLAGDVKVIASKRQQHELRSSIQ